MKKIEDVLSEFNIDPGKLKSLLGQKGFRLLADDEIAETKEWLENYQLGIELFPVITNDESDFIGVYMEKPLLNKIALMQHHNLDFTPKFKDLNSLIKNIENGFITRDNDWENFENNFDYPSKNAATAYEHSIIGALHKELGGKKNSNDRYELLASAIMVLTPYEKIENIYQFLADENIFVRQKCVSVLGDFYQHEPVKEKIRETLKTINNKILEKKVYNGSLVETKKGFWKSLFK
jgi:hypothetical protein